MGLSRFERALLKGINLKNDTKYKEKHLMEWVTSKEIAEKNLQEGEILYEEQDVYVAIKPDA
jgi:hypothetical protein